LLYLTGGELHKLSIFNNGGESSLLLLLDSDISDGLEKLVFELRGVACSTQIVLL
jgi:hypothetical protein